MIKKIVDILNQNSALSDWIIKKEDVESTEVFLIKDRVDMNRLSQTQEYDVRVFVDFEEEGIKFRGESSCLITPSDSYEEMEEKIKKSVFAASFVKNPWFPLPEKEEGYLEIDEIKNTDKLKNNFNDLHDTIYKDYGYRSKVNSCEIFSVEKKNRIVTSKGVDHAYPSSEFSFEIVTDADFGKEPVEIFNGYYLRKLDLAEVEKIVDKQLRETEARCQAVRNKKIESIRLILSSEAVEELLGFYLNQASAAMIFQNVSRAKLGEYFVKDNKNQGLTIRINPTLENSINAKPIDGEGKKLLPYDLYKDGRVENLIASSQFSHYLEVENKGASSCFEVGAGNTNADDLRSGDYIEILAFSSFLIDPLTGDFGGEFRLAKLVQDGRVAYITGGSISENIFERQNDMIFSSELVKRENSLSPELIAFDRVLVAGN